TEKNQMRKAEIHSGCDVLHAVCMAGWCGDILCAGRSDNAVKKGEQHAPRPEERRLITISELLRLVQNIIATLCCSDTDRDFSEFHHKSPDF
ncbi:hypothetical protein, partial [Escherichia coli]|uniref:hypothetical protein n=1 Tax=Escherichia coli TaxID=562 RepID=UPI001BC84016